MEDNRIIIIYDRHCMLCTRTVARLMTLRTTTNIESIPLQDERAAALLPEGYTEDQLSKEIHVIDMLNGLIFHGAEAMIYVMTKLPSLRFIAIIYRIPGMKWLASRIYRWVAKHRYDLFGRTDDCDSGYCEIHHKR
jgi:predicted DCC family thiol-disulfide oxidoreductase YuxK